MVNESCNTYSTEHKYINKHNLNPLLDGARIQWVNPKPLTLKENFIFDRRCVAARWQFGFRRAFTATRHPTAIGGGMPDTVNTGLNPNCQLAARGAIGAALRPKPKGFVRPKPKGFVRPKPKRF